jgi:hypothetical protein
MPHAIFLYGGFAWLHQVSPSHTATLFAPVGQSAAPSAERDFELVEIATALTVR